MHTYIYIASSTYTKKCERPLAYMMHLYAEQISGFMS